MATLIETEAAASRLENRIDLIQLMGYLRKRWLVVVISTLTASILTLAGSLVRSKRYTATASILIEAPAGNDPRGATAVSAIYLESLKTYEHFAESNTLFGQALNHLNLRDYQAAQSLEGLKKRVLRVSKLRDTKCSPNQRYSQQSAKGPSTGPLHRPGNSGVGIVLLTTTRRLT